MLIGHLPAGILLTRAYVEKNGGRFHPAQRTLLYAIGFFASVLPDLDLFYYYFIDNCENNHHSYWTHQPIFWTAIFLGFYLILQRSRQRFLWSMIVIAYFNLMIHMGLDTVVGQIQWLYPVSQEYFAFFTVEHRFNWWVWDFVVHWTFLFEVGIWYWCLWSLFLKKRRASLGYLPRMVYRSPVKE